MFDATWTRLDPGSVAARLAAASRVEDLFGSLDGVQSAQLDRVHRVYRQLALVVHPDRHGNDPLASRAFLTLQRFYALAKQQILDGRTGQASGDLAQITITSRRRSYAVERVLAEGDIAVLYTASATDGATTMPSILKVARDDQDNDLIANEASALRQLALAADGRPAPPYIPRLIESFVCQDAAGASRAVNAFRPVTTSAGTLPAQSFCTLRQLCDAFPDGLDPRHMAWIWRRILIALGHAHARGVVHGAVLPPHILIHPEDHGLLLVDWCASVQQQRVPGAPIPVISPEYESWYPASVLAGRAARPAVDLLMGLRCMVYLLGGDPLTGALPARTPAPLQAYLNGALGIAAAQMDAARLYQDFSDLLVGLWGQRRFVPLTMPPRS